MTAPSIKLAAENDPASFLCHQQSSFCIFIQWLLAFLIDIVSEDFAKMMLFSIIRSTLSGQRYPRCQLVLLLLKSTCSHLVVTWGRLKCHQDAHISSVMNTHDYTTTHCPGQVLTVFSNSSLHVGLSKTGTSQKRDHFC